MSRGRRVGPRVAALVIGCTLAVASIGRACGHCVEDRIAAVYDHAVVVAARGRHDAVMFVGVSGLDPAEPRGTARRLRALLAPLPEIHPGTLRVDAGAAAVSFEFDPARTAPGQMLDGLRGRLARSGWGCDTLRVMRP